MKHKDRPSWFIRNNSTFCTFGAGTERNCHNAQKFSSLRIERNSHNYHKYLISIVLRTVKNYHNTFVVRITPYYGELREFLSNNDHREPSPMITGIFVE